MCSWYEAASTVLISLAYEPKFWKNVRSAAIDKVPDLNYRMNASPSPLAPARRDFAVVLVEVFAGLIPFSHPICIPFLPTTGVQPGPRGRAAGASAHLCFHGETFPAPRLS